MDNQRIEFPGTNFPPVTLEAETELALTLTAANSPVLFGCRNGICGTCLVEVEALEGELPPPGEDEREVLALYAPGNPKVRLACQFALTTDVRMRRIDPL